MSPLINDLENIEIKTYSLSEFRKLNYDSIEQFNKFYNQFNIKTEEFKEYKTKMYERSNDFIKFMSITTKRKDQFKDYLNKTKKTSYDGFTKSYPLKQLITENLEKIEEVEKQLLLTKVSIRRNNNIFQINVINPPRSGEPLNILYDPTNDSNIAYNSENVRLFVNIKDNDEKNLNNQNKSEEAERKINKLLLKKYIVSNQYDIINEILNINKSGNNMFEKIIYTPRISFINYLISVENLNIEYGIEMLK